MKKNRMLIEALETIIRLKKENENDDIEKIVMYIAGSYFYPERYSMYDTKENFEALVNELQDNYTYQIIWNQIKEKHNGEEVDKKHLAMIAFKDFLLCTYKGMLNK